MNQYSYSQLLKKFCGDYQMDSEKISRLTNIPAGIIEHDPEDFNPEVTQEHIQEYNHLSTAFAFLSENCRINEDEYVRGHIKNLTETYGMSLKGIAKFIDVDLKTVKNFIENKKEVDIETRYKIAVRFLSLEWLLTKNPFVDM